MKTPDFWRSGAQPPMARILQQVLRPLGVLYGLGTRIRLASRTPRSCGVPVICVGNLTAGGSGKTPVVRELAERLSRRNCNAHVVSKGYGGTRGRTGTDTPHRVDPENDTAAEVGDEALMLARSIPVWVSRNRLSAATAAAADGADCVLLDDGFQDPALRHDLSLIVCDGATGVGNGFLIPAGPLREPVRRGLARASAVVVIGDDASGVASRGAQAAGISALTCRIKPSANVNSIEGRRVLAFAGIGYPEKFFRLLRELGGTVTATQTFADHHPYQPSEIRALKAQAAETNAALITTEKDYVRLSSEDRADIEALTITLEWEDEAALDHLLTAHVP